MLFADFATLLLLSSNSDPVDFSVDEGHLGVIVALLEVARPGDEAGQKEKHSFSAFLNRSNSYGQTALMLACKNG